MAAQSDDWTVETALAALLIDLPTTSAASSPTAFFTKLPRTLQELDGFEREVHRADCAVLLTDSDKVQASTQDTDLASHLRPAGGSIKVVSLSFDLNPRMRSESHLNPTRFSLDMNTYCSHQCDLILLS